MTGSATASLEVRSLTKSFYDVPAVENVDFTANSGEIHGLLGENGAGKSTLCSVLAGLYRPDAGEVLLDGKQVTLRSPKDAAVNGIGMVYQHFRLVESFTVAENIVLGADRPLAKASRREIRRLVGELTDEYGLEVDPSASIWQLSVGEQQRVEIVKQLVRGARILILDEPTAVLAAHEADRLFVTIRRLADHGHTVILVSHKMQEILDHTDRVTVLRNGRNAGTGAASDLGPGALRQMMFGTNHVAAAQVAVEPQQPGESVLEVRDLDVDGDRGLLAVDKVSLTVRRGEIVGVAGVSGNGQRELQEAIGGLRRVISGQVRIGSVDCTHASVRRRTTSGLAYVPEDRLGTGLASGLTLEENLALKRFDEPPLSRRGLMSSSAMAAMRDKLVARFDIRGVRHGTPVGFMSGGNLQKSILARELTAEHHMLLAAALTRGLDLAAAEAVRDLVRTERASRRGVLLFSEDLSEVLELSDVVLVMHRGRIVGRFTRDEVDLEAIELLMTGEASACP